MKENSGVTMKKLLKTSLALLVLVTLAASCGTRQNGQLIGVIDRPSCFVTGPSVSAM